MKDDCMCQYCIDKRKRIGRKKYTKLDGLVFILLMFLIYVTGVIVAMVVMK